MRPCMQQCLGTSVISLGAVSFRTSEGLDIGRQDSALNRYLGA